MVRPGNALSFCALGSPNTRPIQRFPAQYSALVVNQLVFEPAIRLQTMRRYPAPQGSARAGKIASQVRSGEPIVGQKLRKGNGIAARLHFEFPALSSHKDMSLEKQPLRFG